MLTFISIDKKTYKGATATEVVEAMRDQSFDGQRLTVHAFMRRTAASAYLWSKLPVRSSSPEEFLDDLVTTGIIVKQS